MKVPPEKLQSRYRGLVADQALDPKIADHVSWVYAVDKQDAFFCDYIFDGIKRCMDVVIVILTSPLWILLIALCSICVWIENPRAPIFFVQERTGRSGRRFRMYKFRSMVPNAHNMTEKVRELSYRPWPDIKIASDPRVTRLGEFLRKTHLDELPQVVNALQGSMSLVGPRPTSYQPDRFPLWHSARLAVRPGITGLWQIIQDEVDSIDDKIRLDIAYIDRRCLWLDIQIMVRTVTCMLHNIRRTG